MKRLDEVFRAMSCLENLPSEMERSPRDIVELARFEVVRAKVDPEAAFRAAQGLHRAALCRVDDVRLREESEQAYKVFRSQVARAVLGSTRARATGDPTAERQFLVDLSRLLHSALPEDSERAEQRIRQLDLAAKKSR